MRDAHRNDRHRDELTEAALNEKSDFITLKTMCDMRKFSVGSK
jgi:hypothetical protein